jgi:hypothetical protein
VEDRNRNPKQKEETMAKRVAFINRKMLAFERELEHLHNELSKDSRNKRKEKEKSAEK